MVGQVAAGVQNNARTTTTAEIGARIATVSASNGGRAFNSDGAVVQKHHAGAPAAAAGKRAIAIAIAAIAAMNISRHGNCRVRLCITHAIATSAAAAIASVQKAAAAAIASIATIEGRGNIASNDIAVTTAAAAATGAAVVTISTVWNGLRAGRPTGPCIRTVARDAGVTCIATIATVAVYVTITAPASGRTIKSLCMRRRRQDDWQQQRPRERRGAQKYKRAHKRATIANCHGIPPRVPQATIPPPARSPGVLRKSSLAAASVRMRPPRTPPRLLPHNPPGETTTTIAVDDKTSSPDNSTDQFY
ncbi:hypothetical protein [Mesorhizobium sp. WSM1293]|uniref:hypothetical protein n=1 Tax=Mesorhizobium sp. WSM1293 TaxID=1040984 RepID=UPI0004ADB025|nr:hypothetical protein [Mesorhizobium sp. WSM1293]